jgi:hypothetical protein
MNIAIISHEYQAARDLLYATFAHYPLRTPLPACACCVSPQDMAQLYAAPLPDLTMAHLGFYASKALSTWGDLVDLKHFLPRLLELALIEPQPYGPLMFASSLTSAAIPTWPTDEQAAVVAFCLAGWRHQAIQPQPPVPCSEIYEMLYPCVPAPRQLLDDLATLSPLPARWNFLHFCEEFTADLARGISAKQRMTPTLEVARWFQDPATQNHLRSAIDAIEDDILQRATYGEEEAIPRWLYAYAHTAGG